MNKKFLIAGAAVLVAGGLAILALNFYWLRPAESAAPTARQMEDRAARMGIVLPPSAPPPVRPAAPIDPKKPVRLAIGWLGLPDESQNGQVGDLLLAALSSARNLQLVDRQSLDKVLRESQMSLSGLVRAESATRLGKLLRADWFLLGSAATVNGSNYLVIRIVDARTGTMLNAEIFPRQDGPAQLVTKISAFVRQSRESASHPGKPRVFLAIGGFKDVSANNRQADFPAKLRGYLMAAYQGNTNVTLLEREFVDLLHQEMQLDLAGLTEEGNTNAVQPMQAAFWLVDGEYQSYEVSGFDVEVVLRVHRMFGLSMMDVLRGPPEEPLYRQIKSKIELVMRQQADLLLAPTHHSEIQAQLELGRSLAPGTGIVFIDWLQAQYWQGDSRETRNLEEAMRAFRTALLLDPESHEAVMRLAGLQHVLVGNDDEVIDSVRHVAESSIDDRWKVVAMVTLEDYYLFRRQDRAHADEWHHRMVEELKAHPELRLGAPIFSWGYGRAGTNEPQAAPTNAAPPKSPDPESVLVENTRQMQELGRSNMKRGLMVLPNGKTVGSGLGLSSLSDAGIQTFLIGFGSNRTVAVERLNKLLPALREKFPGLVPDLTAMALPYQLDTNSPVVADFMQSFDQSMEHPEKLFDELNYIRRVGRNCYNWLMDKKLYALAAHVIEAKRRIEMNEGKREGVVTIPGDLYGNGMAAYSESWAAIKLEDITRLAKAYMAMERWQETLDLLDGVTKQPFALATPGPWGGSIALGELADQCRDKLGLPGKDPRVFQLASPWQILPIPRFNFPIIFAADHDWFWLAAYGRLYKISANLETTNEVRLPKSGDSAIMGLYNEPSKLWIGTGGDGIIEYDKQTHESRTFTYQDGLTVNDVGALYRQGDTLWVSFRGSGRGVGRLDVRSGRATALTPSLRPHTARNNDPPTTEVFRMATGRADDLFFLLNVFGFNDRPAVLHYRIAEDTWEGLPWFPDSIAGNPEELIMSFCEPPRADKSMIDCGIALQNLADGRLEKIGLSSGLPNTQVERIALEGNDLWIAGLGFIGVMDLKQRTMRKFCYTHSRQVDGMEIGGGYVWVLMDWSLYRIPLSETR